MSEFEFSYRSAIGEDFLYHDGPVVEVSITVPVKLLAYYRRNRWPAFPQVSGLAVIDTGASVSVLDVDVLNELDIPSVDTILTDTVHGTAQMQRYNASASFSGLGLTEVPLNFVPGGRVRAATNIGGEIIMLIGRDLLRTLRFTYDGPNSRVMIHTETT